VVGEKISGADRNSPKLALRTDTGHAGEERLRGRMGPRCPFIEHCFQSGNLAGRRQGRIEDAETVPVLSPDVVFPVAGFPCTFQRRGVEMEVAARDHNAALWNRGIEKLPDVAAGIKSGVARELVHLAQVLRGE
jgi:hypothetical protein